MYPPLVLQLGDAFPFLIFTVHILGVSSIMGGSIGDYRFYDTDDQAWNDQGGSIIVAFAGPNGYECAIFFDIENATDTTK